MVSDLILRAVLVSTLLYGVCGHPVKGGSDGQTSEQMQQQDEGNPEFDPGFNDWVQAQMGLMNSFYSQDASQSQSSSGGAKEPQTISQPQGFSAGPAHDTSLTPSDDLAFFMESDADMSSLGEPSGMSSFGEPSDLYAPEELQGVSAAEELAAGPFPPTQPGPVYKPGTVLRRLATFEEGRDASSFFDTGAGRPFAFPLGSVNMVPEASNDGLLPGSEHDDEFFHMFITGQLPPGTVTHFSSTYENGRNAWSEFGFERMPSPPAAGTPAVGGKGSPATKGSQDPSAKKMW